MAAGGHQAEGRPTPQSQLDPPPHPLSPLPGTRVLQGGEVLRFPLALLHFSPMRGTSFCPLLGLLSFRSEDYEARTGVAGHQPQVGDYGLKFQQEPEGSGILPGLSLALPGEGPFPSLGQALRWDTGSFLRGLIIQLRYILMPPRGLHQSVRRPKGQMVLLLGQLWHGCVSTDADKGRARARPWEDGQHLFP